MGGPQETIRVLHVDDETDILEVTSQLVELNYEGLAVETARSVEEALDRLEEVDCIVADYVMPGMDGAEFLSRVRSGRPDLPIVFFTGRTVDELDEGALGADLTAHVQKGVSASQYAVLGERIVDLVEAADGPDATVSVGE